MRWAFGGILGMAGEISPTWFPKELGMGLTFVFRRMFSAKK